MAGPALAPYVIALASTTVTVVGIIYTQRRADSREALAREREDAREQARHEREDRARHVDQLRDVYGNYLAAWERKFQAYDEHTSTPAPDDWLSEVHGLLTLVQIHGSKQAILEAEAAYSALQQHVFSHVDPRNAFSRLVALKSIVRADLGVPDK